MLQINGKRQKLRTLPDRCPAVTVCDKMTANTIHLSTKYDRLFFARIFLDVILGLHFICPLILSVRHTPQTGKLRPLSTVEQALAVMSLMDI